MVIIAELCKAKKGNVMQSYTAMLDLVILETLPNAIEREAHRLELKRV
jgi:hypothetical protein